MATPTESNDEAEILAEDVKTLHSMGYAQELAHRTHGMIQQRAQGIRAAEQAVGQSTGH